MRATGIQVVDPRKLNIDFMSQRRVAMFITLALLLLSLVGLAARGLNFGIDFTGGVLVEVGYEEAPSLQDVRQRLDAVGFENALVQNFGSPREVLIRVPPEHADENGDEGSEEISTLVLQALSEGDVEVDVRRVEFVGPQVGEELREQGGLAVLFALIGILIYVSLRFEWRFALGSVGALIHDVVLVLGAFAWLQLSFDLAVLAAILAVIGYSLNDTIVVYDRIRENFLNLRKAVPRAVVNLSVNQMLARTIVTSTTTLMVLLSLYLLGGEVMRGFSVALILGVVIGTYSSIYVASTLALALGVSKQDIMPRPADKGEGEKDVP